MVRGKETSWVARMKKLEGGAIEGAEVVLERIIHELPTGDEIGQGLYDGCTKAGDICRKLGANTLGDLFDNGGRKGAKILGHNPLPNGLSDLIKELKEMLMQIKKTIKNSEIGKALVNFCNAGITLLVSLSSNDQDRAKSWKDFKTAASALDKVIIGKVDNVMKR